MRTVTMPRVESGGAAVERVAGVYQALLEVERADYERHGEVAEFAGRRQRVYWVDRDDHEKGFYLWPRDDLDRLEAGEPMTVRRGEVESALHQISGVDVRLAFARSVKRVRVSADDRVLPADELPQNAVVAEARDR
jgi:hypothetical protein